MGKKWFKYATAANLGRSSRRTRSQGSGSIWYEADATWTASEEFYFVQAQVEMEVLRENNHKSVKIHLKTMIFHWNLPKVLLPSQRSNEPLREHAPLAKDLWKLQGIRPSCPESRVPTWLRCTISVYRSQRTDESRRASREAALEQRNTK